MHCMLARTFTRTSLLTIQRYNCGNQLQRCRKLSVTTNNLLRQTCINNSKDIDHEGHTNVTTDESLADEYVSEEKPRSQAIWNKHASYKYERFAESSTNIIYDFHEEQRRLEDGLETEQQNNIKEEITLERGVTGVFDVEELVDLLREENGIDIVAIKVPDEIKYVDYMVIVTSSSVRHIKALSQLVLQIYKKKKYKKDHFPFLEGKNSPWVAMDLGNIALHIMTPQYREDYDLDTLWTVGAKYDEKCHEEEQVHPPYQISRSSVNAIPITNTLVTHNMQQDVTPKR